MQKVLTFCISYAENESKCTNISTMFGKILTILWGYGKCGINSGGKKTEFENLILQFL